MIGKMWIGPNGGRGESLGRATFGAKAVCLHGSMGRCCATVPSSPFGARLSGRPARRRCGLFPLLCRRIYVRVFPWFFFSLCSRERYGKQGRWPSGERLASCVQERQKPAIHLSAPRFVPNWKWTEEHRPGDAGNPRQEKHAVSVPIASVGPSSEGQTHKKDETI